MDFNVLLFFPWCMLPVYIPSTLVCVPYVIMHGHWDRSYVFQGDGGLWMPSCLRWPFSSFSATQLIVVSSHLMWQYLGWHYTPTDFPCVSCVYAVLLPVCCCIVCVLAHLGNRIIIWTLILRNKYLANIGFQNKFYAHTLNQPNPSTVSERSTYNLYTSRIGNAFTAHLQVIIWA